MGNARIDELILVFDGYDEQKKLAALEEALTLREEITPRLLRILEEVADDPAGFVVADRDAHIYSAILLAHFQEPAAHLPIIRAFRTTEEDRDFLWGDMVYETLPALLLQTCNRDLTTIRALVLDQGAPEYVRISAVDALTFAVVRDMASREEIIAFFSGLFTETEAAEDSNFWNNLVCALSDLHPEESMAVIRQAFADGLVDLDFVSLQDVKRDLALDRETALDRLRTHVAHRIPSEVHRYLPGFFEYPDDDDYGTVPLPSLHIDCARKQQEKRKKKNRVRNKQAKKARKKNRR